MKRVLSALLLTICFSAPARAGSPDVLELQNLMSATEFRAAGLDRLTSDELISLDDWVGRLVVRLLTDRKHEGCASPVDSRILGEFEGWDGHTIIELENGQIWKQRDATRRHTYRLSPRALVREADSGCRMEVDGIEGNALVERIR